MGWPRKLPSILEVFSDSLPVVSPGEANEKRLNAMSDEEIFDLLDRATAYATQLVRSRNWRGSRGGVLPVGKSVQDLVQAAFENILQGAKWDEGKELAMVLKGIIRGMVKNLVESWENRNFYNPDDKAGQEGEDDWVSAMDGFASSEVLADQKAICRDDDDRLLEVIEALKEGSEERRIVESIVFSGARKRAEVLADTGLSEGEYEAAKKRLQRFLGDFRQERATAHQ
jgi:hypothetical protein